MGQHRIYSFRASKSWLVPYADIITLLLVFFVLIISTSVIDQSKFEAVAQAFSKSSTNTQSFGNLEKELNEIIEKNNLKKQVHINKHPLGLNIELSDAGLFQSGEAALSNEGKFTMRQLVTAIKNLEYRNYEVEIHGHTDDVPIHNENYSSNWELSVFRAISVLNIVKNHLDDDKIKIAGYGDTRPKFPNRDEGGKPIIENQAKNRRIEINVFRIQRTYTQNPIISLHKK